MSQPHLNWTKPVVCHHGYNMKKEWYIFFRFYYNGKWKDVKKRGGINKFHDKKERKAEAEAFREARETWLKQGWNPIIDPDFLKRNFVDNTNYSELHKLTLSEALDFALDKHPLAEKSKYDYNTTVRIIKHVAYGLHMDQWPVREIKRIHVKALMDAASKFVGRYESYYKPKEGGRGKEGLKTYHKKDAWSEKAYNKNLDFLSALFTEMNEWEVIEFNPAYHIARREEPETHKFIPFTPEERTIIREYLYLVNYPFFVYWATMYNTGVRPKECLGLQICDYDEKAGLFRLRPFSEKTKTKKERTVVVNAQLKAYLRELKLHELPKDYYIFSVDFRPGPVRVRRTVATDLWDKLVRIHLGIDKYMYATKHTGADDLAEAAIKAGIKEEVIEQMVQNNLGHSSRFMTRRYTQKGIELNQKVIREISPSI